MTRGNQLSTEDAPEGLTIRELAAATGVSAATLRTWESRHGYPQPERLAGGHRRYSEGDVVTIGDIERGRASGQTLPAAIAQAQARRARPEPSVFAGIRRRHPELATRTVRKATLLALSRAIEDECCARAESPVLFGAFQQKRFYTQAQPRWRELARTASSTFVFADFKRLPRRGLITHVAIPADSPLNREWVLVCDAPDHPAGVAGWEVPGHTDAGDGGRRFEVIWTVDPQVVRHAARICAGLLGPGLLDAALGDRLEATPPAASADLRRAQGLLERTLNYLDR
jgi:DNA-binding transcriptional MerR regulator